ncbi:MAG: cation diffusion facilitator family transporter [Myxococcota bacterium]
MAGAQGTSRWMPGVVSLVMGTLILAAKLVAWRLTGSAALLADALESIVNVVAAGFAVVALHVSAIPADSNHPYGHGKIELLSAAFEGGLVLAAALAIVVSAVRAMVLPPPLRELDVGMAVSAGAAVANLLLGIWLIRQGRHLGSAALVADGHHVMSDVWTTVGALAGLGLVLASGMRWVDGLVALLVGLWLTATGGRLVKEALDGLMDREDPELVKRIQAAFDAVRMPDIHGLHDVKAIRSGTHLHVDAHVYVPASWSVARAHEATQQLVAALKREAGLNGEVVLHLDPSTDVPAPRVPDTPSA